MRPKSLVFLGRHQTLHAEVKITQLASGDVFLCQKASDARSPTEQQIWEHCVTQNEPITLDGLSGEPNFTFQANP